MNLKQSQLLEQIRNQEKDFSYLKISQKTGLNLSRVYRIFQGAELKLSEFSVFSSLIEKPLAESRRHGPIQFESSSLDRMSSYYNALYLIKKQAGE